MKIGGGGMVGLILQPAAGGPNDPSVIFGSNLVFWYKADSAKVTHTSTVSVWGDETANAYNLAPEGGAAQPTFTAGGLNSKPIIQFGTVAAGLSQLRTAASITQYSGTSTFSIFAVFRLNISPTSGNKLFDWNNAGNTTTAAGEASASGSGNNFAWSDSGGIGAFAFNFATGAFREFCFTKSASNFNVFINNLLVTGPSGGANTLANNLRFQLNQDSGAADSISFDLAELFATTVDVTSDTTSRSAVDTYFRDSTRWGSF